MRSEATVARMGAYTRPRATRTSYARDLAEALHYAHEQGVLHRDIKPSNVLVDGNGRLRITDFGVAKRMDRRDSLTGTGSVLGTPGYMPPEQATGRTALVGPASDVYSLGALLYALLTGRAPFQTENVAETLRQVVEHVPPLARTLNPSVPVELETICAKCLEKRPDRRYRTARELAQDLERFLEGEPISARPAGHARKAWSWGRRHPWVFTALSAAGGVTLIGLAAWLWIERSFLLFMAENPDFVRSPGDRTRFLDEPLLAHLLSAFLAGITFTRIWRHLSTGAPCLVFMGVCGLCLLARVAWLAVWAVEAFVWEGVFRFDWFVEIYTIAFWSATLMRRVIDAQDARLRGVPVYGNFEFLPAARRRELYSMLMAGSKRDFKRRFRMASRAFREWTDTSKSQAAGEMYRIWRALRKHNPDLVPPPQELGFATVLLAFLSLVGIFVVCF